jgi:hypothetical protein
MKLTSYLQIVPQLRMHEDMPPLSIYIHDIHGALSRGTALHHLFQLMRNLIFTRLNEI